MQHRDRLPDAPRVRCAAARDYRLGVTPERPAAGCFGWVWEGLWDCHGEARRGTGRCSHVRACTHRHRHRHTHTHTHTRTHVHATQLPLTDVLPVRCTPFHTARCGGKGKSYNCNAETHQCVISEDGKFPSATACLADCTVRGRRHHPCVLSTPLPVAARGGYSAVGLRAGGSASAAACQMGSFQKIGTFHPKARSFTKR